MPKISILTPSIRPEMLEITKETLDAQTFRDFEWIIELGDPKKGFTLPADYNKMLRRAKGEIILSLQDCIRLEPNFLEELVKLKHDKAYTFPMIKDGSTGDWRKHISGKISSHQWEIDLASAPMKMFQDVGGFDEAYCGGWSFDNVEIGLRAEACGWEFECVNTLIGRAIDHDALMEHPFRRNLISNGWKLEHTRELIAEGTHRLDNLK